ncbi:MAG: hypothetical protein AAF658_18455, partial [Myxococcota bacterium]
MIVRGSHRGLTRVLIVSGAVHLAAVVAIATLADTGRAMRTPPKAVEVKLTRLGKKRPKEFLPRKQSAPPPPKKTAPTPVVQKSAPNPKPTPEVKRTDAKDRLKNLNRLSSALDRLKKFDEPEGSEDGSEFGNTS